MSDLIHHPPEDCHGPFEVTLEIMGKYIMETVYKLMI